VLDARARGLPVITTRVSVLPELLAAGGGLLLGDATPAAVAEAAVNALSDSGAYHRMSERAIETAQRFSLERWRDEIGDHLRSAWGRLRKGEENSFKSIECKNLKVCFLAGTLGRGGAERQLIYMLKALKGAGVNVRLLCLAQGEALESEIKALGIPIVWVGKSRWRPIRLFRIIKELRREKVDLIHSSHFYTNLYAGMAGRILRIKSIGAVRNDLTSEMRSHGRMAFAQLHFPHRLIANTQLAQERAAAKGVRNAEVLRNAVEVNGLRREATEDQATIRVLCAGRLTEQKRVDRFLEVMRRLSESSPELQIRSVIAGDGPLRSELEQLADSLGLRPRHVEFAGEVADMKRLYANSDLLVLTSDWEGSPNVLLEAMSYGLPVVATRVGGVPEIVCDGENGFLVQENDLDAIVDYIRTLAANAELRNRMGASGRSIVTESHSAARLAEALLKVYEQTLTEHAMQNMAQSMTAQAQTRAVSRELV
jgi:glycosyltransferase involved in cell wall biosynthesis